ncbi:MAG: hypothetical protein AB7E55_32060 [Pigmentiphaga sp.]
MRRDTWSKVDEYYAGLLAPRDVPLASAFAANRVGGLPSIDVALVRGKFLELLVCLTVAKRILEIGI